MAGRRTKTAKICSLLVETTNKNNNKTKLGLNNGNCGKEVIVGKKKEVGVRKQETVEPNSTRVNRVITVAVVSQRVSGSVKAYIRVLSVA